MKIGVYAIARNEGAHVREWLEACGEADVICVTDTGSTDDTPDLLRSGGAKVTCYTRPFRFDKARIYALECAIAATQQGGDVSNSSPAANCRSAKGTSPETSRAGVDIWASFDLDEYPEAGWRDRLEAAIAADPTAQGWRITIDNGGYSFQNIRVHRADGWTWQHACHEVLIGPGPIRDAGFKVVHHQDASKIRDYLPLLELDATENPTDARAWHYLGREYMYLSRWQEALDALATSLPFDTWSEQRSMSRVYMSRCYWRLGKNILAREYAYKAIRECGTREAWVHLTWLLQETGDPSAGIAAESALKVKRHVTYPSEASAWQAAEGWLKRLTEE